MRLEDFVVEAHAETGTCRRSRFAVGDRERLYEHPIQEREVLENTAGGVSAEQVNMHVLHEVGSHR